MGQTTCLAETWIKVLQEDPPLFWAFLYWHFLWNTLGPEKWLSLKGQPCNTLGYGALKGPAQSQGLWQL